jgi:hypothetical protein
LRLTAIALGCVNRKELCAKFRAANARTHCELDRLHKWIQGRALPRSLLLYEDWAKVIGSGRSATWLAACGIDDFRNELANVTGMTTGELHSREALSPPPPAGMREGALSGPGLLCGAFACYSHAWSPSYRGRMIRSALRIEPTRRNELRAIYSEHLMGRMVYLSGAVLVAGRTLHVTVREEGGNACLFFSLIEPGPPAKLLCGVMSGAAFVAQSALPSATRILMVRVSDEDALEASNRYMDPGALGIAADLEELGVTVGSPARLEALTVAFLGPTCDQVTQALQTELSALLDASGHGGVAD